MDQTKSSFLNPAHKMNHNASISTNRESVAFQTLDKNDFKTTNTHDENKLCPATRLALKKQLIELREDKSNYDVLYARFNGLQHKKKLLEEERLKSKVQFEQRQADSSKELETLKAELARLQKLNELKTEEISATRAENEKMINDLAQTEQCIQISTQKLEEEKNRVAKEQEMFEALSHEREDLDSANKEAQKRLEELEQEVLVIEAEVKAKNRQEKELDAEITQLMVELKNEENEKSNLETTVEKQTEILKVKLSEKEALDERLHRARSCLDEVNADIKGIQDNIANLQDETEKAGKQLAQEEEQVVELEEKRSVLTRERQLKEVQVIEEERKAKQLDVEIQTKDQELRKQNMALEKIMHFNEMLVKQLECFEEENREIAQMALNTEEAQEAVGQMEALIANSRSFLENIESS